MKTKLQGRITNDTQTLQETKYKAGKYKCARPKRRFISQVSNYLPSSEGPDKVHQTTNDITNLVISSTETNIYDTGSKVKRMDDDKRITVVFFDLIYSSESQEEYQRDTELQMTSEVALI